MIATGSKRIVECKRCGKQMVRFPAEIRSQTFCSRQCFLDDKKENANTSVCKVCKKVFRNFACKPQTYCSPQCCGIARRTGKHKECPVCGNEFYSNINRKRFCSRPCKVAWDKKHRTPTEPVNCERCGKVTYKFPTQLRNATKTGGKLFCSHACRMGYYASGERNNNWRGGVTTLKKAIRTCEAYKAWQLKVLARDKYTCQLCNQQGGYLNVHHAIPFAILLRSFCDMYPVLDVVADSASLLLKAKKFKPFWNTRNGIAICEGCHDFIHGTEAAEKRR